ncbi:hypothetical protein BSR28_06920 [Boudabousia liubingyangii]|nr:hypothetical protein BSR28_06920 [Boudabousia liubingyangii]
MNWFLNNAPVLSSVVVPILLAVVRPLMDRESGGRALRLIKSQVKLREGLQGSEKALAELDDLLSLEMTVYSAKMRSRLKRKLDFPTVMAAIVLSLAGGGISYSLLTAANYATGWLGTVLWVTAIAWFIFVLLIVFAGAIPNLFKYEEGE